MDMKSNMIIKRIKILQKKTVVIYFLTEAIKIAYLLILKMY